MTRTLTSSMLTLAALLAVIATPASARTFVVTNTANAGGGSLRDALAQANANRDPDVIRFGQGVGGVIDLTQGGQLEITADVEIAGPGANALTLSGGQTVRVFRVADGVSASISQLRITQGQAPANGGGISNQGTLSLANVTVDRNFAGALDSGSESVSGAGIYNTGNLELRSSTVVNNLATGYNAAGEGRAGNAASGAGIRNSQSGSATVRGSFIGNNDANGGRGGDGRAPAGSGGMAAGGGVANDGTLSIVHSTLTNNRALGGEAGHTPGGDLVGSGGAAHGGAVFNQGAVQMEEVNVVSNQSRGGLGSSVTGNELATGGGISNFGTASRLFAQDSSFRANTVARGEARFGVWGDVLGGGLFNRGRLDVERSEVSGNVASGDPPRPDPLTVAGGGGIYQLGSMTLGTSTVSDNSTNGTGGGMWLDGNEVQDSTSVLANDTVAFNQGITAANVRSNSIARFTSTIVSNPRGGANCATARSIASLGFNLEGGSSTCGFGAGTDQRNANPVLGPLQLNGGPTQTHALGFASQALDQGFAGNEARDQRGSQRHVQVRGVGNPPGGDGADVGAFERQVTLVENTNAAGDGSLRAAMANPGRDLLVAFAPDVNGTIALSSTLFSSGQLDVANTVEVIGPGADQVTVSGSRQSRVLHVRAGATVRIQGLAFSDGVERGTGGGVLNDGTLTLDRMVIADNTARGGDGFGEGGTGFGGGIRNTGSLTLLRSTVSDNTAVGGGGGLIGGDAAGGGIFNDGDAGVELSTFTGNVARAGAGGAGPGVVRGGAINQAATPEKHFTLGRSTISGNSVEGTPRDGFGGGVSVDGGAMTIRSSTIAYNSSVSTANVWLVGDVAATNTIVSNPEGGGVNCDGGLGPLEGFSRGYNLEDAQTCHFNRPTDQQAFNPLLAPLADNGGPTTTHAIGLDSPALDNGVGLGYTVDQRLLRRPVRITQVPVPEGGDGSDIGSFELQRTTGAPREIEVRVRPRRAIAGERTCFRITAEGEPGGRLGHARAHLAGETERTNGRGRAEICHRFAHPGSRRVRVNKPGFEPGTVRLRIK